MDQQLETLVETGLEIAVIGMAGRFPGANTIDEFWNNLKNGVESIAYLTDDDLEQAGMSPGLVESIEIRFVRGHGGALSQWQIQSFDASFFGYTPMEAEQMLPQTRLFHMCLWEALEDAGYTPESANKEGAVGLYAGASGGFNWETLAQYAGSGDGLNPMMAGFLNNRDFLSTLIAYRLNLRGPGFTLHTACSTSLVAIHLGCQGLLSGDCDTALAGGVAVRLSREKGYVYQEGMILSPDGHCRPFDRRASGTVAGDGAGVVVLKRLEDAMEAGDNIYAIIKGSAINNDGDQKVGYTAPGVRGQAEVIRKALRMAEVEPAGLSYIECHGTATPLGDVTELEALNLAFEGAGKGRTGFCAIGSVKSNIGHLDTAAGVAGFIKTVLALNYGQIPPSLHFETPNPAIDFKHSPFYVNRRLTSWLPAGEGNRHRAGVSSFGIGGTNAHVLLEEWPGWPEQSAENDYPCHLLTLSAPNEESLEQLTLNLGRHLEAHPEIRLEDAAFTLQVGRKHFAYRRKIVCTGREEAIEVLCRNHDKPGSRPPTIRKAPKPGTAPPIVFLFPGLGSQYLRMGEELYLREPLFRQEMDRGFSIVKQLTGLDLKEVVYPSNGNSGDQGQLLKYSQPVVFIFQYALAGLLTSWGIQPDAMIGYSFGEYAAACVAGVFSIEDALNLLIHRSRLLEDLPPGAMLSVPLPAQEVETAIIGCFGQSPDAPVIAIDNGASCVVSGAAAGVAELEEFMKNRHVMCFPMDADHAIHSPLMEPILEGFEAAVAELSLNEPAIPYVSTVTGDWIVPADAVSPRYWVRQLRESVKFSAGVGVLLDHMTAGSPAPALYLEVGTGHGVCALLKRDLDNRENSGFAIPMVNDRPGDDVRYLNHKAGALWQHGAVIDWHGRQRGNPRRVSLPPTPFHRRRYWKMADDWASGQLTPPGAADLTGGDLSQWFYIPAWKQQDLIDTGVEAGNREQIDRETLSCWLIFAAENDKGLAASLAEGIKKRRSSRETVRVIPPDQDLTGYENYEELLKDLKRGGLTPHRIIHCMSMAMDNSRITPEDEQRRGFYSLLWLARALGRIHGDAGGIGLTVLSTGVHSVTGEEIPRPGAAMLLGPCRVIPQEYPHIRCKHIDFANGQLIPAAIQNRLLAELENWPYERSENFEPLTAYRGRHRWIPVYESHRLEPAGSPLWLRKQGVYIIIGGLGDIGSTLARYLLEKVEARVVITGRARTPGATKWAELEELQKGAAQLLYCQADAAHHGAMTTVFELAIDRFQHIDGVIHSAGIISGDSFSPIENISTEQCALQARAKIVGLQVLKPLLDNHTPDFCLLISSISTVLGGLGFVAYSAVNHYMDAFAARENLNSVFPWLVVDWDGTNPENTIAAFERIFSSRFNGPLSPVIFSAGGRLEERIRRWVKLEGIAGPTEAGDAAAPGHKRETPSSLYSRPDLSSEYVAPRNEVERQLAQIWQNFFGIEEIGVKDQLFELGGDSLKAINIISIIHKEMNVTVPIKVFFDSPTIEGLERFISGTETLEFQPVPPAEAREYYPLSSPQKRLYLLHQLNPKSLAYNSVHGAVLEGGADFSLLTGTLRLLIDRHEILRTSFKMMGEEPVQVVHPDTSLNFNVERFQLSGPDDSPEKITRDFSRPFDMSSPPFFRVGVIRVNPEYDILLLDMHHLITDGVSFDLFLREFSILYRGGSLETQTLHYKDYVMWSLDRSQGFFLEHQQDYWLEEFPPGSGEQVPVLNLPADYARPRFQDFEGRVQQFTLDENISPHLKSLASSRGATLFMVLLAVYEVFLLKITGQEEVVVGTGVAGRRHPDLQSILGMFVNTLVLRGRPQKNKLFGDFLEEIKTSALSAFDNQEYPFEDLVEQVQVRRDTSRNPLFDTLFQMQNVPIQPLTGEESGPSGERGPDLALNRYNVENHISKFDLTLFCEESGNQLLFLFEYARGLFKAETIETFIFLFEEIARAVIKNPDRTLGQLVETPEHRKKEIINRLNHDLRQEADRLTATMTTKTVRELLLNSFQRFPDNTAIHCGNRIISYSQLDHMSEGIFRGLVEHGVTPPSLVGILPAAGGAGRVDLIAAIIGIIKAGAGFVPLDPALPRPRLDRMLADTRLNFVITPDHIASWSPVHPSGYRVVTHPDHPLYVYFTSGSTGLPKAMLGRNQGLLHFLQWQTSAFNVSEGIRVSQLTAPTFDAFLRDVFLPLSSGGAICIPSQPHIAMDAALLLDWLDDSEINLVHCVPGVFRVLLAARDLNAGRLEKLETILMSGEAIHPSDLERWYQVMGPRIQLINLWGTSETSLAKTAYFIRPGDVKRERVPVGTALPGAEVVVLNENMLPCDIWQSGELYIKTPFRTQGYLNDPELNALRFIKDPLTHPPSSFTFDYLHRTGDLGRKLPGGLIDVMGRNDRQVKVRGIRVELGDIESVCTTHPMVSESVVIKGGESSTAEWLCAYVLLKPGAQILAREIKDYLSGQLPEAMVPAYIIRLETFPRRTGGKVDYDALPDPLAELTEETQDTPRIPPADETEETILRLWAAVLAIPAPSISNDSDFFRLGGHSLNGMILAAKIHRECDAHLTLRDVFRYPTIREQALIVREKHEDIGAVTDSFSAIPAVEEKDYHALSPAQKRLFILQQITPQSIVYNMPEFYRLDNPNMERLQESFRKLIRRHESLRTSFLYVGDEPVQRVLPEVSFNLRRLDTVNSMDDMIEPFDLSSAPLFRAGLLGPEGGDQVLMVDMHHIISDGISHQVLVRDFMAIYNGEDSDLPPVPTTYRDYSRWLADRKDQTVFKQQERYWLKVFSGEIPVLSLPTDFGRPAIQQFEGRTFRFALSAAETASLKSLALETHTTFYMVVLSLYAVLLSRLSGQRDIVIGTPVAGREHADLENVIGMFINTLPLRLLPDREKTFNGFLREVKQLCLEAFEHQEYPFEELVDHVDLEVKRDASRNPLFDTAFVMQNMEPKGIHGAGTNFTSESGQYADSGGMSPYPFERTTSKFDLSLHAVEAGESLSLAFEYASGLFTEDTIRNFAAYFREIALSAAASPDIRLGRIALLNQSRQEELLARLNRGLEVEYPREKTIHQLFSEQTARTPDNVALVWSSNRTNRTERENRTYKELKLKADDLAHRLHEQGVRPGDIVAIKMERSLEMIEAIMAVLQAGAAYLPIDPDYPEDRADYMLKDSAAKLLMDQSQTALTGQGVRSPLERGAPEGSGVCRNGANPVKTTDPAYIIYTSGSTGKPKGVMVEHRNVVRLLFNDGFQFDFNEKDVWSLFHSISFDFSVWEIFGALLYGGRLLVVPAPAARDPEVLSGLVLSESVTVLNQIPSIFINVSAEILKQTASSRQPTTVRYVIFGGEALNPVTLRPWHARYPATKFVNMYGITETTVHVTYKEIGPQEIERGKSNIGRAIPTLGMYIMDDYLQLLPPGITGEILVGGHGVARGYLNRPELTALRFIPVPFASITLHPSRSTLYRSGDLGMLTPGGDVIYMGRKDRQVKVRGFRIELAEIEQRILTQTGISKAVVTVSGKYHGGDRALVAYVVPEPGEKGVADTAMAGLKSYLSRHLPAYMVPDHIVRLDRLPITASGKVDHGALPAPDGSQMAGAPYVAPENQVQQLLADAWKEVLGIPRIGIYDNFFEVGGNSIKVVKLKKIIMEKSGIDIPVALLFQYMTIHSLVRYLEGLNETTPHQPGTGDTKPAEKKDLSLQQERAKKHKARRKNKRTGVLDS